MEKKIALVLCQLCNRCRTWFPVFRERVFGRFARHALPNTGSTSYKQQRRYGLVQVVVTILLSVCHTHAASVLDIFPDTGLKTAPGKSSCTFDYKPCGSTWSDGVHEDQVFLASIKGDGWQLGVGKGGQVYSLRGLFGESVPPQRVESPWNDEVWQAVVTSEGVIGPIQDYQNANRDNWNVVWNATFPLMYFVHQAGIYTKGAGTDSGSVAVPFYSPCLRKRWNPETRMLELVNWMQQARTPCVWKSGVLIYTAYRDLGQGIIEINQVLHNFGPETLTFLNTPWGGVRASSLPHIIMSSTNGSWEAADGFYGWTDVPKRNLVDTGGWAAWTQDPKNETSPALALVFGTDIEDTSNGKREDEAIRWGMAGSGPGAKVRDYQVAERMSHAATAQGGSLSIRWYLVVGELAKVRKRAAELSEKAGVSPMVCDTAAKQSVWIKDGKVTTQGGEGAPWIKLNAFPSKGTVPVFLLKDRNTGTQMITVDPYALAETETFPNPLPKTHSEYSLYQNRVIYKQYSPHIGYENLLGYAYDTKPANRAARKIVPPASVTLHKSAQELWLVD